jgi:hypothetical protein
MLSVPRLPILITKRRLGRWRWPATPPITFQMLSVPPGARFVLTSIEARLEFAESLYGEERLDAALAELDRVYKDFPDVHLVRGNVGMRLGHGKEGAREFELFCEGRPMIPEFPRFLRLSRGMLHPLGLKPVERAELFHLALPM